MSGKQLGERRGQPQQRDRKMVLSAHPSPATQQRGTEPLGRSGSPRKRQTRQHCGGSSRSVQGRRSVTRVGGTDPTPKVQNPPVELERPKVSRTPTSKLVKTARPAHRASSYRLAALSRQPQRSCSNPVAQVNLMATQVRSPRLCQRRRTWGDPGPSPRSCYVEI